MKIEKWPGLTPYTKGVRLMEDAVAEVLAGGEDRLIFCEHAPVLTVGTSGKASDVHEAGGIPVVDSGRGGQVTYHGPGQRVVYPIVNLKGPLPFKEDVRAYVRFLQEWLIASLQEFNINAYTNDDIGVWVNQDMATRAMLPERKIAAIGIRVRRWVAYHGIALNVAPDLKVYQKFTPCGITDRGVTSMADLGVDMDMDAVDAVLETTWGRLVAGPDGLL